MRAKKHATVCAVCREPKRSRYRAIVDDYLCEACHNGVRVTRAEQVSAGPVPAAQGQAVMAPARDNAELAQFDLRHLEHR